MADDLVAEARRLREQARRIRADAAFVREACRSTLKGGWDKREGMNRRAAGAATAGRGAGPR